MCGSTDCTERVVAVLLISKENVDITNCLMLPECRKVHKYILVILPEVSVRHISFYK